MYLPSHLVSIQRVLIMSTLCPRSPKIRSRFAFETGLEAEIGYGIAMFGGVFTGTPHAECNGIAHDAESGHCPRHRVSHRRAADPDKPFSAGGASLRFPRDPAGHAIETVNCGCQSLPGMQSWEVKHPGRRPFSSEETVRDPIQLVQQAAGGQEQCTSHPG